MNLEERKQAMLADLDETRLGAVSDSYLRFELKYLTEENFAAIARAYRAGVKLDNNSNSALLYCLGLTDKYNPFRKVAHNVSGSGPDIDTDFSPDGRDKLIEALQEKFGKEHVARICTYTPWNLKTSVIDFAKVSAKRQGPNPYDGKTEGYLSDEEGNPVYGHYSEGEAIAEQIPDSFRGRHTKWADLNGNPEYKPLIKRYADIFDCAGPVDGQPKTDSIHACGVLISPEPLSNQIPVRKVRKDSKGNDISWYYITQWEGPQLENIGFTKYDLLVIDNLKIAQDTCHDIGKTYDWISEEVELNDEKAFELINRGLVGGLFQIEENHVIEVIQKTRPRTVADIAAITSVIRPGPRDAGLLKDYIKYCQTGKSQNNLHPLLDDILAESGGVMIYQEQVLRALQIMSGMDLATADKVRRAMGKKKIDLMKKYEEIFLQGCKDLHNVNQRTAANVWKAIAAFADYGFNKSHAWCYSLITYQTAYLKAHYPVEFMLNLLSSRIEKPDKLQKYIREARLMDLEVRPPGVNSSGLGFSKVDDTTIGFGLNAIQGIGKTQTEKILEAKGDQPFASIDDFFSRIDRSKVNSKVTTTLAMAGAFDEFGYEREALVERLPEITEYYKKLDAWYDATIRYETREREIAEWEVEFEAWNKMKKEGLAVKLPEAVVDEELGRKVYWSPPRPKKPVKVKLKDKPAKFDLSDILRTKKRVTRQMVNWEAQYCKFFISAHPLDFITIPEDVQYNLTEDIGKSSTGQLLVAVSNIEERKIKNGKNKGRTMATITVQDHSGYAEVTVFAKHYEGALQEELEVGKVVYFPYRVDDATGSIPKVKLAGAMMCI